MKKKTYLTHISDLNGYKKILLIMKLSLILSLFCTLTFSANSLSQDKSFSMNFENVKVKDIIRSIEDQSNYRFFYNDQLNEINRLVTINTDNLSVNEVLDKLFRNTNVDYKFLDNNLIVIAPKRQNQVQTITGKITDSNTGDPLPGVYVVIEGTNAGTISDINGEYTIAVSDTNKVLQYSFIGYLTEKTEISGRNIIDVNLVIDITQIDEVVVVGYGTQKKTTLTGSVSSAKGEVIAESPTANISSSLAGRVSGVSMKSNGGQPGSDNPDIHIRGIATTGNSAPLVVVDGIIRNNINQIDPNNIETITVLKDAAAVAPFGMGGANGVILITTKSGKSGEMGLSFNAYFGYQTPNYKPNMLSGKDYLTLMDSANLGNYTKLISNYDELHKKYPDAYPNSNFYNDVANMKVPVQNYDLQLSGGNDRINIFAGFGYYSQDGMFENLGYERYSYNIKAEAQATKTTKVVASIQGSMEKLKSTQEDADNIIWQAVKFIPTDPMVFSNGLWGASQGGSPVGNIKAGYNRTNTNTFLTSVSVEQQIPFIKGLSVKGAFSYDPVNEFNKNWKTPVNYYQIEDTSVHPYVYKEVIGRTSKKLYQSQIQSVNYTYQGYINYYNTFGKHAITLLGVAEARRSTYQSMSASIDNFLIDIDEFNLGSSNTDDFKVNGGSETGSQVGYVYRIGYNYADKYIFEASGRYDGHYTFAPGKRFGYFPAYSVAWRISEENFLKNKFNWLNSLKIRGSWGKSGNLPYHEGELAKFQYLNGYEVYGDAYPFGSGSVVSGSYVKYEANPAITWEASTKSDIGFDLSMWGGKISFEADYFYEKRNNMLIPPKAAVPVEYGIDLALKNLGEMSNQGIEFAINANHKFANGIVIGLAGNYSYTKNKIITTVEDEVASSNPNTTKIGKQLDTPIGYQSQGLFSTDDDLNKDGQIDSLDGFAVITNSKTQPGDVRYKDLNGDGKIDETNDRAVIGHPRYPSITYGFTPTFEWKGIDLSLFFQGAAKVTMNVANFQTQPFSNNKSNTSYEYYDNYWRADRQDAKYPRLSAPLTPNNTQYSDFWMRDASYLRLKNLVLGYTIPNRFTTKIGIKTLRAYFSGQNLLTFSKIKFMDPEEAERNTAATYFYPINKVYTIGVNVTF